MNWKQVSPKTRLYLSSFLILLAGTCTAIAIFLTAPEGTNDVLGYELSGGRIYPVEAGSSKAYIHDLMQYGGKGAVLADEFDRWFAGLWRGRTLAYTIASIAVVLAGGIAFVASRLPPDE